MNLNQKNLFKNYFDIMVETEFHNILNEKFNFQVEYDYHEKFLNFKNEMLTNFGDGN